MPLDDPPAPRSFPPPPPPPPDPGGLDAPPVFIPGRMPVEGLIGPTGLFPGSGAAGTGVVVSVRDMVCNPRSGGMGKLVCPCLCLFGGVDILVCPDLPSFLLTTGY